MKTHNKVVPYLPDLLPVKGLVWEKYISLISDANAELGKYAGTLQHIINPEILLSPLTKKEAVLSSKIEGTIVTLDEVLEYEAKPKRKGMIYNDDIKEIVNYDNAMRFAIEWMKERPLTNGLLRQLHEILLDSGRGESKGRGSFRTEQNHIGALGSKIEEATYIPPPPEHLSGLLEDFEQYFSYSEKDTLVQTAIIHAQFELIHPFMDGNGRIGRIIIPLFLFNKDRIPSPMFYISAYLEKNRDEYCNRLGNISSKSDWDSWIVFFLTAIKEQAKENSEKANAILKLYEYMKREFYDKITTQYSLPVLDSLFAMPVFSTTAFISYTDIPQKTARRIIKKLLDNKIIVLIENQKGRNPSIYAFHSLIEIVNR